MSCFNQGDQTTLLYSNIGHTYTTNARTYKSLSLDAKHFKIMGGATGAVWGVNVPHTFGTSGVQGGTGGCPMKMIFASTADSLYSVLYK